MDGKTPTQITGFNPAYHVYCSMTDSDEDLVQNGSRPCNHRGCSNQTESLRRAYCSVWHEFLDLIKRDSLYEGTRRE